MRDVEPGGASRPTSNQRRVTAAHLGRDYPILSCSLLHFGVSVSHKGMYSIEITQFYEVFQRRLCISTVSSLASVSAAAW